MGVQCYVLFGGIAIENHAILYTKLLYDKSVLNGQDQRPMKNNMTSTYN